MYCVTKQIADRGPNVTKNASALVVTISEKGKQFMLAVSSKSVAFRTKVSFNKSEEILL